MEERSNETELSALSRMMVESAREALEERRYSDALDYISAVTESDNHDYIEWCLAYIVLSVIRKVNIANISKIVLLQLQRALHSPPPQVTPNFTRAIDLRDRLAVLRYARALESSWSRWTPGRTMRLRNAAVAASQSIIEKCKKIDFVNQLGPIEDPPIIPLRQNSRSEPFSVSAVGATASIAAVCLIALWAGVRILTAGVGLLGLLVLVLSFGRIYAALQLPHSMRRTIYSVMVAVGSFTTITMAWAILGHVGWSDAIARVLANVLSGALRLWNQSSQH